MESQSHTSIFSKYPKLRAQHLLFQEIVVRFYVDISLTARHNCRMNARERGLFIQIFQANMRDRETNVLPGHIDAEQKFTFRWRHPRLHRINLWLRSNAARTPTGWKFDNDDNF